MNLILAEKYSYNIILQIIYAWNHLTYLNIPAKMLILVTRSLTLGPSHSSGPSNAILKRYVLLHNVSRPTATATSPSPSASSPPSPVFY